MPDDKLTQAKAALKDKVNHFKENIYPRLAANPATRQRAMDTLNAAALAASESESLEGIKKAEAELDGLTTP